MNKVAKALTDYVIHKGVIKEEERNMYEYGFVITLEMGLSLIISFCIACILHMIVEGILFFVIFIPLRSYAGGLHLDYYWYCLTLSCLTFSVILLITEFVELPIYIVFVIFIGLELLVYYLYPVENVNRQVDAEENAFFRKRLKIFLLIDLLIASICVVFGKDRYLMLIVTTFLMVVITMILGKHKNNRRLKDICSDANGKFNS